RARGGERLAALVVRRRRVPDLVARARRGRAPARHRDRRALDRGSGGGSDRARPDAPAPRRRRRRSTAGVGGVWSHGMLGAAEGGAVMTVSAHRALALAIVLAASGCTVLFDPDRLDYVDD